MIRFLAILSITLLTYSLGCFTTMEDYPHAEKFQKLFTINNHFNYIYIGKLDRSLLVTISNLNINETYSKVLYKTNGQGADSIRQIFEIKDKFIGFSNLDRSSILLVLNDFKRNTLNTTVVLSSDKGKTWDEISCPIPILRKVIKVDSILVAEGDLDGTGALFFSKDLGKSWSEINSLNQGYKSITLLKARNKKEFICIGEHKFNKDENIVTLNLETESYRDILKVEDLSCNIEIIGSEYNLGIYKDGELDIYKSDKDLSKSGIHFSYPREIALIDNIYFDGSKLIITGLTGKNREGHLSWISTDHGRTWYNFYQNEHYELIYNTLGRLIVKDQYNNVGVLE